MIKRKKGQSIVEFALVLPVLLLILMGIIEFGMMFNAHVTMVNAAREGARYGSVPSRDDNEIRTRVKDAAVSLNLVDGDIAVDRTSPDKIKITIEYSYQTFTPVISAAIGNPFEMKAYAVMSLE